MLNISKNVLVENWKMLKIPMLSTTTFLHTVLICRPKFYQFLRRINGLLREKVEYAIFQKFHYIFRPFIYIYIYILLYPATVCCSTHEVKNDPAGHWCANFTFTSPTFAFASSLRWHTKHPSTIVKRLS